MRDEKLGYKIREVQLQKVPYSLVLGDKEKAECLVTYRRYGQTEQLTVSVDEFIEMISNEMKNNLK